ncbi:MAG: flagellar protein FlaG [Bacillota bacterium]|nr:flagellar protein FlaG [Bacillota bacterium]
MIDRLSAIDIPPIQPRTATNDGVRIKRVTPEEKSSSTDQFDQGQSQPFDQKKKDKVQEIVKGLNNFLEPSHTSYQFKLHEKLNEYYVTIVNDDTNEVIQEIPAKKLLDTYADMMDHLGLLIDKKI